MNDHRLMRSVFIASALCLSLVACGNGGSASSVALTDDAVVVYRFRDSSVPPEFHRSFTLTITSTEVRIQVDSYGDVLADVVRPMSPEVWHMLVETAPSITDVRTDQGSTDCAGGTGRSITITDSGETLVDLELAVCGTDDGEADRVDEFVQPVIDSLGDWEEITA